MYAANSKYAEHTGMLQRLYLRFLCTKRAVCSWVPEFAAYFGNYRPRSKAHAAMKTSATTSSCRGNVKGPLPETEQRPFFISASRRVHGDCITENILP